MGNQSTSSDRMPRLLRNTALRPKRLFQKLRHIAKIISCNNEDPHDTSFLPTKSLKGQKKEQYGKLMADEVGLLFGGSNFGLLQKSVPQSTMIRAWRIKN